MDWRELQTAWDGDPASIKPLGDFVLVKPFPLFTSLIIDPKTQMTKDGRWRLQNRETGNRFGRVVAMGAGDRVVGLHCGDCGAMNARIERSQDTKLWKCSVCAGRQLVAVDTGRAPMNLQVGDVVIFPRVPSNEMKINGEEYCWLREEQHVLAVVDEEIAA